MHSVGLAEITNALGSLPMEATQVILLALCFILEELTGSLWGNMTSQSSVYAFSMRQA